MNVLCHSGKTGNQDFYGWHVILKLSNEAPVVFRKGKERLYKQTTPTIIYLLIHNG